MGAWGAEALKVKVRADADDGGHHDDAAHDAAYRAHDARGYALYGGAVRQGASLL